MKLTDTQLIVLSSAAGAEDGFACRPKKMNPATATKVAASLVGKELAREIRTRPGAPVWREAAEGRGLSLKITRAGRDAIGVIEDKGATVVEPAMRQAKPASGRSARGKRSPRAAGAVLSPLGQSGTARLGSKKAEITALLMRAEGASLDDLIAATGWLPHTTRAAITGLRKAGHVVERRKNDDGGSTYRIPSVTAA